MLPASPIWTHRSDATTCPKGFIPSSCKTALYRSLRALEYSHRAPCGKQSADKWGAPVKIVCDRFRLSELRDVVGNACAIEPRVTQWSSSSADIRALRKICRDGPLSVDPVTSRQVV